MLTFYETLPTLAIETIFISLVGWLGFWLLVRSVGVAKEFAGIGGPCSFLTLWGAAILAKFQTHGTASSVIHTLYYSLLAIGCLAWLIGAMARAFTPSTRDRG